MKPENKLLIYNGLRRATIALAFLGAVCATNFAMAASNTNPATPTAKPAKHKLFRYAGFNFFGRQHCHI